jgi:hypothetical protein
VLHRRRGPLADRLPLRDARPAGPTATSVPGTNRLRKHGADTE